MTRARGFSLLELVIVVVIVGIIAAIAIPRLGRVARGADESALRAGLSVLRDAIDRYAVEHDMTFPGQDGVGPTFWKQLRRQTDAAGNVGTTAGIHIYGPYVRARVSMPVGPNAGASGIRFSATSPPTVDESNTKRGWAYNSQTGAIVANTDDLDDEGIAYDTY